MHLGALRPIAWFLPRTGVNCPSYLIHCAVIVVSGAWCCSAERGTGGWSLALVGPAKNRAMGKQEKELLGRIWKVRRMAHSRESSSHLRVLATDSACKVLPTVMKFVLLMIQWLLAVTCIDWLLVGVSHYPVCLTMLLHQCHIHREPTILEPVWPASFVSVVRVMRAGCLENLRDDNGKLKLCMAQRSDHKFSLKDFALRESRAPAACC